MLYVAEDNKFLGSVLIADQVKADAQDAVKGLRGMGIGTAMLTGDAQNIENAIARQVGVDEAYCELLPQDKVEALEHIQAKNGSTAFVGDGINDAPVLARADVGIAMGGAGSDAAIEAADIVLMTDEPSSVPRAVRISKRPGGSYGRISCSPLRSKRLSWCLELPGLRICGGRYLRTWA